MTKTTREPGACATTLFSFLVLPFLSVREPTHETTYRGGPGRLWVCIVQCYCLSGTSHSETTSGCDLNYSMSPDTN